MRPLFEQAGFSSRPGLPGSRRRFLAGSGAVAATLALTPSLAPRALAAESDLPELPPLESGGSLLAASEQDAALKRFRALCISTAQANVLDGRPIPSRAYAHGTWMRDAYWTLAALRDVELQRRTWLRFAERLNPRTGQVPSALLNSGEVHYAAEDESTIFFLLMALDLQRAGVQLPREPLNGAARYAASRVEPATGRVLAGPGPFTWWLDTLILAERDVVAYTQGVWAVGLRALVELRLPFPLDLLFRAEEAYARLDTPSVGAMTLSEKTTLLDVSALVGEHLSLRLFHRPLLSDDAVTRTIAAFREVTFADGTFLGFPVCSSADGGYLPEKWFHPAPDNWPGYYHNGGSWLLYDALALDVARAHGVERAEEILLARVFAETRRAETLNEYIATTDVNGYLGTVPFVWRSGYAWNSYVGALV